MYDDIAFGQLVKQRRKELDLTQDNFAELVGCSTETISKIERGERRPSRQIAERMAQVFELPREERDAFIRAARALPEPEPLAAAAEPKAKPAPPRADLVAHPAPRPLAPLPIPPTAFVGREAELADLARLLADPDCRLLTLTGPGGIGKTRLALEAAARRSRAFADGVAFVPLNSVGAPDRLAPAIADALGFGLSDAAVLTGQILGSLREKSLLLLLDNMEHLLDSGGALWALLVEILQHAPGVKLLITSRERLNLQGEWVVELQGLPLPKGDQAAGFEESSAVELFLQTARRARAGFAMSPEEQRCVAHICRLVEGMPLGIELAASWVRVLPCNEIAAEIERTIDFLGASARDMPARHRSLRAVFDHSWNLLTDEERAVFRMLSVFRGGFRREAAEWVAGATLHQLSALVDKSLLRRSGAGRYDMHELVRQYAAAQLEADQEAYAAARDRHCGYYATLLQHREKDLKRARQKAVITEVVAEIDNIRLAWDWAAAHAKLDEIRRAVRGLSWLYELRTWFHEGEAVFARAARTLRAAFGPALSGEQAIALGQVITYEGWFCFRQGHYGPARELLQQSIALVRPTGDQVALADALTSLGMVAQLMGEYNWARELLDEGLALGRALDDAWNIVLCLGSLGMVAHGLGEYAEAERLCREALSAALGVGSVRGVIYAITALSIVAFAQGQYAEAQSLLRAGFATSSAVGDYWGIGSALNQLGEVARVQGEYAEAQYMFRESFATFREIGDRLSMARALVSLGRTTAAAGESDVARQYFRDAWRVAIEAQVAPTALDALLGLATLLASEGDSRTSLDLIAQIEGHPAAGKVVHEQAARLRAAIDPSLSTGEQAAAARPFAETVDAILKGERAG